MQRAALRRDALLVGAHGWVPALRACRTLIDPPSPKREGNTWISAPTVTQSALRGIACRCPRCGKGKLYAGFLNLRPNCEACGLDYAFIDAGDGPAIFIIMLAGAIVVTAALIVEIKYQPPFWLHAALWLPLILATTLLPLRSMKSLLIALQFHHKAAPGRLIDREPK